MQDLPFLLKRLLRDIMDPQRSFPLVIRARVYLAVKLSLPHILCEVMLLLLAAMLLFAASCHFFCYLVILLIDTYSNHYQLNMIMIIAL